MEDTTGMIVLINQVIMHFVSAAFFVLLKAEHQADINNTHYCSSELCQRDMTLCGDYGESHLHQLNFMM